MDSDGGSHSSDSDAERSDDSEASRNHNYDGMYVCIFMCACVIIITMVCADAERSGDSEASRNHNYDGMYVYPRVRVSS